MSIRQPIKRSSIRLFFGRIFYFVKKQVDWQLHRKRFARKQDQNLLPHVIFEHRTLLRRPLKDVDMQLQENKITNLRIAIESIDGLIIKPGETFSYWYLIGNPTKQKGYIEGMILKDGQVGTGIGGGLCQLSNLLYWMTLHTPLTVEERWRHSYDVFPDVKRKLPFGSGATCAYPNIDLQIHNQTSNKFQLHVYLTDTHLVGEWRSEEPLNIEYRVYEKDHAMKHELWGGYTRHNCIMRDVIEKETGKLLSTECVTENHAIMMYTPFLESGEED